MSQDPPPAPDYNTVNLDDEVQARYWTQALGIPEPQIREIIARHGDSADAVRAAVGSAISKS